MKYPIKNLLGIDCFGWDLGSHPDQANKDARTASLQNGIISTRFQWLRIYCDAGANGQSVYKTADNTAWKFNPDGRGYLTDTYIQQIRANLATLKVNFCYQNLPLNISNEWAPTGARNTQYRHPGTNVALAATWAEKSADEKVIALRGGTNHTGPDYPLYQSPNAWEPVQVMLKGAGLYNRVEGGNEYDNGYSNNPMTGPGGTLVNPDAPAITGAQYAVVWKASGEAIKQGDPNMEVCTTGVMTENPQILTDALAWYDANNGGVVPFQVYQFHCYPWGWSHGNLASALPPEYNMVPAAKAVVTAANNRCKVCIGEWGYDLHPDSDMGIRPFGTYTGEQIRAYWVVRSLLGFAKEGIESSYYYKMRQDYGKINDTNSTIFITSNLFEDVGDDITITRRFTGDMFRQMSDFGDFVFDSVIVEDSTKRVFKFKNGTQELYAGWTIETITPVVVNGVNRASFTEVKTNYTFPAGTKYTIQPGNSMASSSFAGGSIELSTKPVFVLVGDAPINPPTPTQNAFFRKGYYQDAQGRLYYKHYQDSNEPTGYRCDYNRSYQWYKSNQ
jgi:hypothetical protein